MYIHILIAPHYSIIHMQVLVVLMRIYISLLHLLYWAFTSCFLQTLVRSMESAPTLMEASAVPVFLLTLDHSVSTTARATPIPVRRALFVLRQWQTLSAMCVLTGVTLTRCHWRWAQEWPMPPWTWLWSTQRWRIPFQLLMGWVNYIVPLRVSSELYITLHPNLPSVPTYVLDTLVWYVYNVGSSTWTLAMVCLFPYTV